MTNQFTDTNLPAGTCSSNTKLLKTDNGDGSTAYESNSTTTELLQGDILVTITPKSSSSKMLILMSIDLEC